MVHISYSEEDTRQFAKDILRRLGRHHIILLSGELGSGKTVLAQAIADELGVKESVTSPSYVLMKVYQLPSGQQFSRLVHVDLYRVEYDRRLDDLGLSDYLTDEQALIVVEWPERILDSWPAGAETVHLYYGEKSTTRAVDF